MRNLKISHQLFLLIGALMVAFAATTYFQIKSASEAIYSERYDMLRTQTESARSIMEYFHAAEVAGEMTREAAQTAAYDAIEAIRFEPDGYFFGYDYDANRVFYPGKLSIGKNYAGLTDSAGNKFLMDIIKQARSGGGWTEYEWQKPGEPKENLYPKAAYAIACEPWQVTIGTGLADK